MIIPVDTKIRVRVEGHLPKSFFTLSVEAMITVCKSMECARLKEKIIEEIALNEMRANNGLPFPISYVKIKEFEIQNAD